MTPEEFSDFICNDPLSKKVRLPYIWVYFAQAQNEDGLIKIGSSTQPIGRLDALKYDVSSPVKLLAVYAGDVWAEKCFHALCVEHASFGEWFRPHPYVMDIIRRIRLNEYELPPLEVNWVRSRLPKRGGLRKPDSVAGRIRALEIGGSFRKEFSLGLCSTISAAIRSTVSLHAERNFSVSAENGVLVVERVA